jgi:hypothetical protein
MGDKPKFEDSLTTIVRQYSFLGNSGHSRISGEV